MDSILLSSYFTGFAVKELSSVEANKLLSNQHEFNGVSALKRLFGQTVEKKQFRAKFLYLSDEITSPVVEESFVTWYDARESKPRRSEHRLYFPTTAVSECAEKGDLLIVARRPDNSVLILIAAKGSTVANQVRQLFGIVRDPQSRYTVKDNLKADARPLNYVARSILEEIGIRIESESEDHLDKMLRLFGESFPPTRQFSSFARSTIPDVSVHDGEDAALFAWIEREEQLFRIFENYLVRKRLTQGFGMDVDAFIGYSLTVQNRRKSRAGYSLENHLEELFRAKGIRFKRTAATEGTSRPDFIFPGEQEYRDSSFPASRLTMLGVKATCKDRWRQVLAEADRVKQKHLLTLEGGISVRQTAEMQTRKLRLVVPRPLISTYTSEQRSWLMDIEGFCKAVTESQQKHAS